MSSPLSVDCGRPAVPNSERAAAERTLLSGYVNALTSITSAFALPTRPSALMASLRKVPFPGTPLSSFGISIAFSKTASAFGPPMSPNARTAVPHTSTSGSASNSSNFASTFFPPIWPSARAASARTRAS